MQLYKGLKLSVKLSFLIISSALIAPFTTFSKENSPKETFTVVIDPGHGGKDFGAVDNNVKEKDINLGVAKKLAEKIKKGSKDVNVVMTRDNDTFITLQDRANIANNNKGNLFISIHTNSVDKSNPRRTTVAGASVYALGLHKDKNNLQVAMRENAVIELEKNYEQKYSGFDPSKDESYIIFEMAQKKNLGQSLKFADIAQKSLVSVAGRGDRGVKQAGFWVLWATSMPAVLVELDFICNPNSAVYMGSEKGQDQMAEALYKAFEKYHKSVSSSKNTAAEVEVTEKTNNGENYAETPVMPSAQPVEKQITDSKTYASAAGSAKRRRRSDASKRASLARNLETASIPLHSENERLPAVEKPVEKVEIAAAAPVSENSKSKKDKKNKKDKRHKSVSGYHPRVEKLKTFYKIQILASTDLLKQNSPEFHGLTPVKSFKEHNLYKYTYGESESKQEMETLLKKVKQVIPDAFIIKSMK
ncbi:MAG: N-acetylmuramoyl-L-alanine amidase [Bacteroides sp.]|nr:N-acetylmuramoyl-L-alanine amidase [Bacteroides sp.]